MTLEKAIEILTILTEDATFTTLGAEREALNLGIEALKEKLEREKGVLK